MSVIAFVNNHLGLLAIEALRREGASFEALVLHPEERRRYGAESIAAAGVPADRVVDATQLKDPATIEWLRSLGPAIGLSVLFGYKLAPELFSMFPYGCFNLHPALLPYGRGADPNAWALIDGEPAGTTLHWMDRDLDTGDIVGQRTVEIDPTDTGATLYRRLEAESVALLKQCWPDIAAGQAPRRPQSGVGSTHRRADLKSAERIDLDATYTGRQLLDRLRAFSFPPHPAAYFDTHGKRIRVRIELTEDPEGPQS